MLYAVCVMRERNKLANGKRNIDTKLREEKTRYEINARRQKYVSEKIKDEKSSNGKIVRPVYFYPTLMGTFSFLFNAAAAVVFFYIYRRVFIYTELFFANICPDKVLFKAQLCFELEMPSRCSFILQP